MGVTCKPCGRDRSLFQKLQNQIDKEKAADKKVERSKENLKR